MLGTALLLTLLDILTLELWYFSSYAGFVIIIFTMDLTSRLMDRTRRRILLLIALGGVGFIAVGIKTMLPIIEQLL